MKKIALTCSTSDAASSAGATYFIRPRYIDYIMAAAELYSFEVAPVVLPPLINPALLDEYVSSFDGFMFTGGDDVDPSLYGEERHEKCGDIEPLRDAHELALLKKLRLANRPVFGICRGIQIMAVACGGTLWQDIYAQKLGENAVHAQNNSHTVTLSGALAADIGSTCVITNSYHHQAVKTVGTAQICAISPDSIIEAIEDPTQKYYRAVQWHPELNPTPLSHHLLQTFFNAL